MPANKVLYAVRMPADLKRLIDQAAESGGVTTSQLVIEACWKYLEYGSMTVKPPDPDQTHIGGPHSSISAVELASWGKLAATPVVNGNAAMRAFMSKLPAITPVEPEPPPLLRPCPKIGWDHPDGDPRKCRLQAGHKGNCSPGEKVDA